MRTTAALREFIADELPEWLVLDEPRQLDQATGPSVLMAPSEVTRIGIAGSGVLAVSARVTVWILTEKVVPREVEPALDHLLFTFLSLIESHTEFMWETATRTMLEGAGHAWQIDVTHVWQITER